MWKHLSLGSANYMYAELVIPIPRVFQTVCQSLTADSISKDEDIGMDCHPFN